jgi:hypothetical protein
MPMDAFISFPKPQNISWLSLMLEGSVMEVVHEI